MNVKEYLRLKYKKETPTTITRGEAMAFGIPWPLTAGWFHRHGGIEVDKFMVENLKRKLSKRLKGQSRKGNGGVKHTLSGLSVLEIAEKRAVYKPKQKSEIAGNFYESREWREVRYKTLTKFGAVCQCCGASRNSGKVMHVDHIKPRSKFPHLELELGNLQVLCEECNLGKSNIDESDWRGKPRVIK
jgi:HNH endonuclease